MVKVWLLLPSTASSISSSESATAENTYVPETAGTLMVNGTSTSAFAASDGTATVVSVVNGFSGNCASPWRMSTENEPTATFERFRTRATSGLLALGAAVGFCNCNETTCRSGRPLSV